MDRSRNDDAARRCYAFKAGGDIDGRAKQIPILVNDVSGVNADAHLKCLLTQAFLKRHRAINGVYRTRELRDDTIASSSGNPTAVLLDLLLRRLSDCA